MCKGPEARENVQATESRAWGLQGRANKSGRDRLQGCPGWGGQGRGPIQSTDSGGQAPPSPAFSQRALKENRLCVSQARTQPVNPATKHCRNPTQQAERVAIRGDGCLQGWLFAVICNLCFSPLASGSKNWDGRGGPARRSSRGACEPAHLPSSPASASAPLWASGHPSGPFVSG